jgi:hypothetical protein
VDDWNREETEEDAIRAEAIRRLQVRRLTSSRPSNSSASSLRQGSDLAPAVSVAALKAEMEAARGAGEGQRAEAIERQIIEIFKTALIEGGEIPGLHDDMGPPLPDDMDHVSEALSRSVEIGFRAKWAAIYDAIARRELGLPEQD